MPTWLKVGAIVFVAFILARVLDQFSTHGSTSIDSGGTHTVTYRVDGDSSVADITYHKPPKHYGAPHLTGFLAVIRQVEPLFPVGRRQDDSAIVSSFFVSRRRVAHARADIRG